jgi:hypothetical protein
MKIKSKIIKCMRLKFFLSLSYFSILAINFTGFAYAENLVTKTEETKVEFSWQETDNGVISNIAITDNETYTYENVGIKFFDLPSDNLKLAVSKIEKSNLPDDTQAESDAYDIKLFDEDENEVTDGFNIQVTFYEIDNTDDLSVISFQDTNEISQANLEESNIDDGNIVVTANHLTIFLVVKVVDNTSGGVDYIYSDVVADTPSAPRPTTLDTKENDISTLTTFIRSRGHWPLVSTDVGNDYIDFYFGDISTVDAVSAISFISNFRIQPNKNTSGISGNVHPTSYDAKLLAKNTLGGYTDLNIAKQDLIPNFSSGESQSSSNYEEITTAINSGVFNQLDLTNFVIRYTVAGEHTGNHTGVTGLATYIDSVGLNVLYVPADTTPPTVDLVFPTPGPAATSFQAVFSENIKQAEAENPANYFLTSWPGAGGSGDLVGDVTIVYNPTTFTATVTFTNAGWYISPEQQWGVENIHDLVGNLLAVSPYSEYSTPLVAPVTTDSGIDTNWHNTPVTVTLTCVDTNGSGCKTTYYTTDNTDPSLTSSTGNSFTLSTEGQYTIKYFSTDNAGNTETIKIATNTVKIDKTIPQISVTINPTTANGDNGIYVSKPTITLTANDNYNVDYIQYQINSTAGTWIKYTNTVEINEGTTKFYYQSVDKAGNISAIGLKNISVDLTTPDAVENVSADFNATLNESSVNWETNDDDIYSIKVYRSENNNVDQSSSNYFVTVDRNADGITDDHVDRGNTYYYLLVSYDEAGNEGGSVKVEIKIPEDAINEIIITTETFAAPQIVVPNTVTATDNGQVEGVNTEKTTEEIGDGEVLGEKDVKIDLSDSTKDSGFISFLIKYWWLFLLTPFIFWLLWWIFKRNKRD